MVTGLTGAVVHALTFPAGAINKEAKLKSVSTLSVSKMSLAVNSTVATLIPSAQVSPITMFAEGILRTETIFEATSVTAATQPCK